MKTLLAILIFCPSLAFGQFAFHEKVPERGYPGFGVRDERVVLSLRGVGNTKDYAPGRGVGTLLGSTVLSNRTFFLPIASTIGISNAVVNNIGSFSISLWCKPISAGVPSIQRFLTKYPLTGGSPAGSFLFDMVSATSLRFIVSPAGTYIGPTISLTLTNGLWYHLVATYATGTCTVYNAASVIGVGTGVTTPLPDSAIPIFVGTYFEGDSSTFRGQMNDIVIWNVGLTTNEVVQLDEKTKHLFPHN